MKRLKYPADSVRIEALFRHAGKPDQETETSVQKIIERVRKDGDKAVVAYARRFDGVEMAGPEEFFIPRDRLKAAWEGLPSDLRKALERAHRRIRDYHEKQKMEGFTWRDDLGNRMDQRVLPLARVGVYAPGGTAAYPSTVLMDVVPAKVAGVREVLLITPPLRPGMESVVASYGAAWLAGVDEVLAVGGAHGLAAAALGTRTVRRVDKIVGPGNRFVAAAKRQLYGEIDIDMIAGPSEILILADSSAPPAIVAADLLSQAEHDPDAQAVAILIGEYDMDALEDEIKRQTKLAPRRGFIRQSLKARGALIQVEQADDAVLLSNLKAPEHLEIMARGARTLSKRITNAGAIFLGRYTPEAIGDYVAGPNHTLPTGGTARFFSPLSVWSFQKTSHVVECSKRGLADLADTVITIAEAEGLDAHAEAVRRRR
ncbi:histidinol dehydrogenase [bacterium]|nr:histidinol dehydrogenase [bacterium]